MADAKEVKSKSLRDAYATSSVEDSKQLYATWAETYDKETLDDLGWMGFKPAAQAFAEFVTDEDARILDAGCGTGISGVALKDVGYSNLHGRDLSPEMLEVAARRHVYKSLEEVDLTAAFDVDQPFDAVFSSGVFGFGPPFPEHLIHLTSVVKPGGYTVLTVNGKGWVETNWESSLPHVVTKDGLNLVEQRDIAYLKQEGIDGKLLVFKS